jgi:uncharacterized protein with ParB-like and HNH nuclease domain
MSQGIDFRDYKILPNDPSYRVTVDWEYLDNQIAMFAERRGLNMNPDYQRGRVWTDEQQIKYIEFIVSGGIGANEIRFNNPWLLGSVPPKNSDLTQLEVVDGLQRLTAVQRFNNNEIPVFGHYRREFQDRYPSYMTFTFIMGNYFYKKDVLKWYLAINSTGTPHSSDEIAPVNMMKMSGLVFKHLS